MAKTLKGKIVLWAGIIITILGFVYGTLAIFHIL